MMEREGAIALLPATLLETPRSEGPKNYIRNIEAVGSNPITSTGCAVPHSVDHFLGQSGRLDAGAWTRHRQPRKSETFGPLIAG